MPVADEPVTAPLSPWQASWPILLAVMIVIASGRSQVAGPDIHHIDKVTHFSVYGLLATLVCRLRPGRVAAWCSVLAVSAFGASDEWHQTFTPGRTIEFGDWVADTAGAAVAVALYVHWHWYRRSLETPLWRRRAPAATAATP